MNRGRERAPNNKTQTSEFNPQFFGGTTIRFQGDGPHAPNNTSTLFFRNDSILFIIMIQRRIHMEKLKDLLNENGKQIGNHAVSVEEIEDECIGS